MDIKDVTALIFDETAWEQWEKITMPMDAGELIVARNGAVIVKCVDDKPLALHDHDSAEDAQYCATTCAQQARALADLLMAADTASVL